MPGVEPRGFAYIFLCQTVYSASPTFGSQQPRPNVSRLISSSIQFCALLVTRGLGDPLVMSMGTERATESDVFADEDFFHSLDFVLTFISVAFNYTGPYFLK
jgi:hypothetical protein